MIKTRTFEHQDGRREVIRILNRQTLALWSPDDPLSYESSIVWTEDVEALPFVRVMLATRCAGRTNPLTSDGSGRIVGYAKLTEDAPANPRTGMFTRRVFYLRESDIGDDVQTPSPSETGVVDPKTIYPTIAGCARGSCLAPSALQVSPSVEHVATSCFDGNLPQAEIDTVLDHADQRETSKPRSLFEMDVTSQLIPQPKGSAGADERQPIPLRGMQARIGRLDSCDIVLRRRDVSAIHCELTRQDPKWFVKDLFSTNGVKVNGKRIVPGEMTPLEPGDSLTIASHRFTIVYGATHVV